MNQSEILNDGNFSKNNDFFSSSNATSAFEDDESVDGEGEVDDRIILAYFTFIGIGVLFNCGIIIGLLRSKRKGKIYF